MPPQVVQVELCRRVAVLLQLVVRRGLAVESTDAATAVLQRTAMVGARRGAGGGRRKQKRE